MQIGWVSEGREGRLQLSQRQGKDSLDLGRVDRDTGDSLVLAEQLLGDQPTERMADDNGRSAERLNDPGDVIDDVIDTEIGHSIRVIAGLRDRCALTRPAGRHRVVTCLAKELEPRVPARGVQPETVNEYDWRTCGHRFLSVSLSWRSPHSAHTSAAPAMCRQQSQSDCFAPRSGGALDNSLGLRPNPEFAPANSLSAPPQWDLMLPRRRCTSAGPLA